MERMPLLGISSILLHLQTCIKIKELIRCHLHYFPKKEPLNDRTRQVQVAFNKVRATQKMVFLLDLFGEEEELE